MCFDQPLEQHRSSLVACLSSNSQSCNQSPHFFVYARKVFDDLPEREMIPHLFNFLCCFCDCYTVATPVPGSQPKKPSKIKALSPPRAEEVEPDSPIPSTILVSNCFLM
ncbi:hypothetical protein LINPERHAP1_LOCUS41233 [Linum perenne]